VEKLGIIRCRGDLANHSGQVMDMR
jgi:hypothetical protein